MPKDSRVYLEDILASLGKIEQYTKGLTQTLFEKDQMVVDAVTKNLEVIGEAVKRLPADLKKANPEIEWRKVAGLRDILIHEYAGVDLRIVWDVVTNKLPTVKLVVRQMLKKSDAHYATTARN